MYKERTLEVLNISLPSVDYEGDNMKLIGDMLDRYYGRARIGKWETRTGKSIRTPHFMPKISHKSRDSKIDAKLIRYSTWIDAIVIDLPFMNRWESLAAREKLELERSKTLLLDLRTDKLISGDKKFLEGFKNILGKNRVRQKSDALDQVFQKITVFLDREGDPLTEANITPAFINDFIEMVIKEHGFDIITAPYFPIRSTSIPPSEIVNLNKECITKTIERMNQLGMEKDIVGVICISPSLLKNREIWDLICELFAAAIDMWSIRLSSLVFETKTILPVLWEFIDMIVQRIGSKFLLGLDFELYDDGPFGFPLLAIGLDAFSSGICETDEVRKQKDPSKEKPFGFYYLRRDRFKKHLKEVLPENIQQCDCPVCKELLNNPFDVPLDKDALQARLKMLKPANLKKNVKDHFLYCREQEISEYEKTVDNEDFLTIVKGIARSSNHSDWEHVIDQGG